MATLLFPFHLWTLKLQSSSYLSIWRRNGLRRVKTMISRFRAFQTAIADVFYWVVCVNQEDRRALCGGYRLQTKIACPDVRG